MSKEKIKIIIDTDLGDDSDDVLALGLALRLEECELLGITTVFRNTNLRTEMVLKLLDIYKRPDIKVYSGIGKPLLKNEFDINEIPCQYSVFSDKTNLKPAFGDAIDFIINSVRENKDLTVVAIGPLTNLATAVVKAPDVMKKAKVVLMGGNYKTTYPEWNIYCDPESAKIVFENIDDITMVGLDVTVGCILDEKYITPLKTSNKKTLNTLYNVMKAWENHSGHPITLHDPLTLAYVFNNDLLKIEEKEIIVDCYGKYTAGATLCPASPYDSYVPNNKLIKVATDVKKEEFINMFVDKLLTE